MTNPTTQGADAPQTLADICALLSARRADLAAFCQRWGIRDLALFGSVLRPDFSAASDIDVLVQFHDEVRYSLFDLVRMGDELAAIFGRDVDIIDRTALERDPNYLRREQILESAQVIYAA